MAFTFTQAKRESARARICLTGASGGGKTLSALYLAYGMTGDWKKIVVIDSERRRALFYANRSDLGTGEFIHCDLEPPYSVERYVEAMREAAKIAGKDGVVIIDSGSHCWKGTGGVLEQKEQIANQRGVNDFSAWNLAGKIQNNFIDTIMDLDCDVIVTLRSKTAYAQETDVETGKTKIKKLGLEPEQRAGFEFEMSLVMDIDKDTHFATIIKDNTFLDSEGFYGVITPELGKRLRAWLSDGVEPTIHTCSKCGKKIKTSTLADGTTMTAEEIIENSVNTYGRELCIDCCIEEAQNATETEVSEETVEEEVTTEE